MDVEVGVAVGAGAHAARSRKNIAGRIRRVDLIVVSIFVLGKREQRIAGLERVRSILGFVVQLCVIERILRRHPFGLRVLPKRLVAGDENESEVLLLQGRVEIECDLILPQR